MKLFLHRLKLYLGLEACGGSLYVEDAVVIDVPTQENCIWKVQTDKDHILVFSLADGGNFERIYDFTTVWITKIKCFVYIQ
jgi:hypothetical protein